MKKLEDIYSYLVDTSNLIAQSRFGNKFILKGGTVLMSKLLECGRTDLSRLTSDIDLHCDSKEVWFDFYTNIESILNQNKMGYIYKITYRRSSVKGFTKSDSLRFILHDTLKNIDIEFKMDMNILSNNLITCDYSPILNMYTYDFQTSMSDKIIVVSSQKIFRRIKDVYDIAVMASICNFSYTDICQHINVKHGDVELRNMLVPEYFPDLSHAYNLFDGIQHKPKLENLIGIDSTFLQPFYIAYKGGLTWDYQQSAWIQS